MQLILPSHYRTEEILLRRMKVAGQGDFYYGEWEEDFEDDERLLEILRHPGVSRLEMDVRAFLPAEKRKAITTDPDEEEEGEWISATITYEWR